MLLLRGSRGEVLLLRGSRGEVLLLLRGSRGEVLLRTGRRSAAPASLHVCGEVTAARRCAGS